MADDTTVKRDIITSMIINIKNYGFDQYYITKTSLSTSNTNLLDAANTLRIYAQTPTVRFVVDFL